MTVESTDNRIEYTGNGATTPFTYPFRFISESDIKVYLNGVLQSTGFSVAGVGVPNTGGGFTTGTVTFTPAPANGVKITLLNDPNNLQQTAFPPNDPFPAGAMEGGLDKQTLLIQRLKDRVDRTAHLSDGDTSGADLTLTPSAGTLVGWNGTGTGFTNFVPPVNSAQALQADLANPTDAAKGSSMMGHLSEGASAVGTTVQSVLRERRSLFRWLTAAQKTLVTARGPYSASDRTAMLTALTNAWNDALTGDFDLDAPSGLYEIGEANFPWRNPISTSLLDGKNVTLWCSGPNTEFKTVSANGADVFQLNALKNFHVRGFPTLSATVSGSVAGSNGVSITNGYDNLTLEIYALNLPSLDKTTHVDGGKALTLQNGTTSNASGMLRAAVIADGCAEGFGFEPDLVTSLTKNTQVDVHILARNCYMGVKHVAAEASGALSTSMCSGVRVRGSVVDCQHGVFIQRAHGIDIDVQINSTKTAAQKRLNPSSVAWFASDTVVDGAFVGYAKNSRVDVRGNVGACDYKARLGGVSAGSSGLNGATEFCDIILDLGGTAAISDLLSLNSGGNSLRASRLNLTSITAASLPSDFTTAANANRILWGANYTGTATLTLTGCTTSPTGDITYSLNGDVVTINFPEITGTSNTTSATLTGLPAEIQPATPRVVVGRTINNGTDTISLMDITGSVVTLFNGTSFTFTNTGTKGQKLCSVTYKR